VSAVVDFGRARRASEDLVARQGDVMRRACCLLAARYGVEGGDRSV